VPLRPSASRADPPPLPPSAPHAPALQPRRPAPPLTLSFALTSTRGSARRAATTGAHPLSAAQCRGVPPTCRGEECGRQCGRCGGQGRGGGAAHRGAQGYPEGDRATHRHSHPTRPQDGALESPRKYKHGRGAEAGPIRTRSRVAMTRSRTAHARSAGFPRASKRAALGAPRQAHAGVSQRATAGVQRRGCAEDGPFPRQSAPLPAPTPSPSPAPTPHLVLCVDLHARVCEEGGHDRGVPMIAAQCRGVQPSCRGGGAGAVWGRAGEGRRVEAGERRHRGYPEGEGPRTGTPPDPAARRRVGKPS